MRYSDENPDDLGERARPLIGTGRPLDVDPALVDALLEAYWTGRAFLDISNEPRDSGNYIKHETRFMEAIERVKRPDAREGKQE